jgi:hypothetical protein
MTFDIFSNLYEFIPPLEKLGSLHLRPGDGLVIAVAVIFLILVLALFAFLTKAIFLRVQKIPSRTNQICLLLCLFFGMIFLDILGITNMPAILIPPYDLLQLVCNHIWWIAAVILPTYVICPDIREKRLWKIVVVCFMVTVAFRTLLGYFCVQILGFHDIHDQVSGLFHIPVYTEALLDVGNISLTFCLACAGYWMIGQLIQRVPRVKRWLAVE